MATWWCRRPFWTDSNECAARSTNGSCALEPCRVREGLSGPYHPNVYYSRRDGRRDRNDRGRESRARQAGQESHDRAEDVPRAASSCCSLKDSRGLWCERVGCSRGFVAMWARRSEPSDWWGCRADTVRGRHVRPPSPRLTGGASSRNTDAHKRREPAYCLGVRPD